MSHIFIRDKVRNYKIDIDSDKTILSFPTHLDSVIYSLTKKLRYNGYVSNNICTVLNHSICCYSLAKGF